MSSITWVLLSSLFFIISVIFIYAFIVTKKERDLLTEKYSKIIDIDAEVDKKTKFAEKLIEDSTKKKKEIDYEITELKRSYSFKKEVYDNLLKEISILQDDLEIASFGIYNPFYSFDTSEKYKEELDIIRQEQKTSIKDKSAIHCSTDWEVEGSKVKGRQMTNKQMKLMMRAFNGECDAIISKVSWNNIVKMEEKIKKVFEIINKLGESNHIYIFDSYLELKIKELRLKHEYVEKKYQEKEEQRAIREQMREEEKVKREIEKAQKDAELEESRYEKALEELKLKVDKAKEEELDALNVKIAELDKQLKEAQEKKDRALARAQLTKSGHIYVISNIGSFGEDIYKIGMTRRLEPLDRVKELGDASVPFSFDVHAMIYSENAPELETKLHHQFDNNRLNLINNRKEFFKVNLEEIEKEVKNENEEIEFTKLAEARQYRETMEILNKKKENEKPETSFPNEI